MVQVYFGQDYPNTNILYCNILWSCVNVAMKFEHQNDLKHVTHTSQISIPRDPITETENGFMEPK